MSKPSGVNSYDETGRGSNTRGSNHPDTIGPGREMTSKTGGQPPTTAAEAGESTSYPSLSQEADGTADLGSNPRTKTSLPNRVPSAGDESFRPSGVRSHSGKSAPKSVE